jgi:hypothetical protein
MKNWILPFCLATIIILAATDAKLTPENAHIG